MAAFEGFEMNLRWEMATMAGCSRAGGQDPETGGGRGTWREESDDGIQTVQATVFKNMEFCCFFLFNGF